MKEMLALFFFFFNFKQMLDGGQSIFQRVKNMPLIHIKDTYLPSFNKSSLRKPSVIQKHFKELGTWVLINNLLTKEGVGVRRTQRILNKTAKLDIRLVNILQGSKTVTFLVVFVIDKKLQVHLLLHSSCTMIKK